MKLLEREGENPRLMPESAIDKLALTAFCCQTAEGKAWSVTGREVKATFYVGDLTFDDYGYASASVPVASRTLIPLTVADTLKITFWCEYDGYKNKVLAHWECPSLNQANWVGYRIVF